MSMTDPIADMLTRIRNACGSKHRRVDMPASKMKTEIARLLKESNFIQDYQTLTTEEGRQVLRIRLRYAAGGQPVIRALPLTATVDALRAVMLQGAAIASLGGPLAVIAVWLVVSFGVALRIFRWR